MSESGEKSGTGARPVAVVTGASAGVGRATALEFASRGYDVGLVARGRAGLEAAAGDVRRLGARACHVVADVADPQAVDTAADSIAAELGEIDVWVNNAMTTVFGRIPELTASEIERATRVTYLGQVHGVLTALRHMGPRDRGAIVFVGSALSYRGIPLQSAYCASKFAVRGFHESLRTELLHRRSGIVATIVHLPAMNTPQFQWCRTRIDKHPQPVPPIYQPEVAARAIADAVRSGPRQKVVGTWNWMLIKIAQWIPGVGDHYMAATGVDAQLTAEQVSANRPDNLMEPVDVDRDFGSHGRFDDRARGLAAPGFLKSLPGQARDLLSAVGARAGEIYSRWTHAGDRR
ncbi:MAG: SDR family oxidoreductase [Actinomycetota bacterium]